MSEGVTSLHPLGPAERLAHRGSDSLRVINHRTRKSILQTKENEEETFSLEG